jgi:3-oxoacyl-(acyl-carrier-protein) synthase
LGGAINCGGQNNGGSMTFPNPEGVIRCLNEGMKNANIKPKDIDLINGHLTGTKADALEVSLWKKVLSYERDDFPYIQSTKSMIGHGLAAAGSMESIACILQLYYEYIHPTINCEQVNTKILSNINEDCIPKKMIKSPNLNIVAKSTFGFGDVNCSLFFKKWKG